MPKLKKNINLIDKDLENLAKEYSDLEEKILEKIEELPEYGNDCDCDNPTSFSTVDVDNTLTFCLNCGGTIYL